MTTPTPTGAPINILVDDDESNIRKTLAICLEAEGHHMTAVSNFQDAVAEASRHPGPDSGDPRAGLPEQAPPPEDPILPHAGRGSFGRSGLGGAADRQWDRTGSISL